MQIDNDTLKQLTYSLSQYNPTANTWVEAIARGVTVVGLTILGISFLLELAKETSRYRELSGDGLGPEVIGQISIKYFLVFVSVVLAPEIFDVILWIVNAIGHIIGSTGGLNNQSGPSGAANLLDMDRIKNIHWYQEVAFSVISFLYTFIYTGMNFVVTVLIFLRFTTLYIFKAVSPFMVSVGMTEDYKSVAINYWKQIAALSLQSVVLITILKLLPFFLSGSAPSSGSMTWGEWVGYASIGILKLIAAIFAIISSQSTARRLVGV